MLELTSWPRSVAVIDISPWGGVFSWDLFVIRDGSQLEDLATRIVLRDDMRILWLIVEGYENDSFSCILIDGLSFRWRPIACRLIHHRRYVDAINFKPPGTPKDAAMYEWRLIPTLAFDDGNGPQDTQVYSSSSQQLTSNTTIVWVVWIVLHVGATSLLCSLDLLPPIPGKSYLVETLWGDAYCTLHPVLCCFGPIRVSIDCLNTSREFDELPRPTLASRKPFELQTCLKLHAENLKALRHHLCLRETKEATRVHSSDLHMGSYHENETVLVPGSIPSDIFGSDTILSEIQASEGGLSCCRISNSHQRSCFFTFGLGGSPPFCIQGRS